MQGRKLKEQGASIPAAARTARTAPQQEYNRKCLMCQACTRHKRNCACHGTDRRSPEALRPPTDGRCIWNSAQRRSKQYRRKRPATYNRTRKPDTRDALRSTPGPWESSPEMHHLNFTKKRPLCQGQTIHTRHPQHLCKSPCRP